LCEGGREEERAEGEAGGEEVADDAFAFGDEVGVFAPVLAGTELGVGKVAVVGQERVVGGVDADGHGRTIPWRPPMRVLFWNILHGGGPERLPEILLTVLGARPDVVALCEFRATRGGQLRAGLADHGLEHQVVSHGRGRTNGMLVASRGRLEALSVPSAFAGRELDVRLEGVEGVDGLHLTAVHVADEASPTLRASHWNRLIELARSRRQGRHLLIGDLNTARGVDAGGRGAESQRLGLLATLGYRDAWQAFHEGERGVTWEGPWSEGRRIDAAHASEGLLIDVAAAEHLDAARARGHSDHSALLVEIHGNSGLPAGAERKNP
jgi:endonuclease/exonuclease/phosphatase family metal-dependent hydrolase